MRNGEHQLHCKNRNSELRGTCGQGSVALTVGTLADGRALSNVPSPVVIGGAYFDF